MTYTPPTVNYSATIDGTYTTLTGVQSVLISRGRRRIADPFPQSSCVIELIPANSYAVPLAIGQFIDVRQTNVDTSRAFFSGKITDVERVYAMPYNSGTGAAPGDRIRITATGGTGILGTNYSTFTWGTDTYIQALLEVQDTSNVRIQSWGSSLYVSAQSVYGGGLEVLNQLIATTQFLIDDADERRSAFGGYSGEIFAYPVSSNTVTFSDTGTGFAMKQLEYLSSAQNTFSKVNVNAEGLATQSAQSGTPPYNTLNVSTYNVSTADALALAQYLYDLNSTTVQAVPASITTDTTVAPTCMELAYTCITGPFYGYIGSPVTVLFRGTTATAGVQGFSAAFYPDRGQVQLYLSPSIGTPFTLDSTASGVLDTNRLGYP